MLETIITVFNTRLKGLNLFSSLPGLAEQVKITRKEDEKIVPAVYCSKGEYDHIRLDEEQATAYFRQISDFVNEETEDSSARGCATHETRTYSLVCVGIVPKNVYNTDDAYIDDKIALNVKKALTLSNNKDVRIFLTAESIYSNVSSINTDRNDVVEQEYENVKITIDYDKVYFSIAFEVVISGDESCFDNIGCNNEKFEFTCPPVEPVDNNINFIHGSTEFKTY